MIRAILEVSLNLMRDEVKSVLEYCPTELEATLTLFEEGREQIDVWFHREMELPFVPLVGMPFELALIDDGLSMNQDHLHSFGRFVVLDVVWVEADGKLHIRLEKDDSWDTIIPLQFDTAKWNKGMYAQRAWRKEPLPEAS